MSVILCLLFGNIFFLYAFIFSKKKVFLYLGSALLVLAMVMIVYFIFAVTERM